MEGSIALARSHCNLRSYAAGRDPAGYPGYLELWKTLSARTSPYGEQKTKVLDFHHPQLAAGIAGLQGGIACEGLRNFRRYGTSSDRISHEF
jgi:hypothetical protein